MKKLICILIYIYALPALAVTWMADESVSKINDNLKNYCEGVVDKPLLTIGTNSYSCNNPKISQLKITRGGQVKQVLAILKLEIKTDFADFDSFTDGQVTRVDTFINAKCRLNADLNEASFLNPKNTNKLSSGFERTLLDCMTKSICINKGICADVE